MGQSQSRTATRSLSEDFPTTKHDDGIVAAQTSVFEAIYSLSVKAAARNVCSFRKTSLFDVLVTQIEFSPLKPKTNKIQKLCGVVVLPCTAAALQQVSVRSVTA